MKVNRKDISPQGHILLRFVASADREDTPVKYESNDISRGRRRKNVYYSFTFRSPISGTGRLRKEKISIPSGKENLCPREGHTLNIANFSFY